MLKELLESKKCIKIIAGAGNTNKEYVRRLIETYIRAGVVYFDISADLDIVKTVKGLFKKYNVDGALAVSYGISDDPHIRKVEINSELCTGCGLCKTVCEWNALTHEGVHTTMKVINDNCIGCGACFPKCGYGAMTMVAKPKQISETLPAIVAEGIDTVEFHVSGLKDVEETYKKWSEISEIYDGMLSLCIDRSKHSDLELRAKIANLTRERDPYTTMIQADGVPMSGTDESAGGTLQAIAICQIVERMGLPLYILMSGGTNEWTSKYAKEFGLHYHGVSFGSCARKLIKKYIEDPNFDTDETIQQEAVNKAKAFIDEVKRHMQ